MTSRFSSPGIPKIISIPSFSRQRTNSSAAFTSVLPWSPGSGGSKPAERNGSSSSMRAARRVQAILREAKACHGYPADQVRSHDLLNIFRLHEPVPNRLRIHDNRRSVLTLVEATGLVDPNSPVQIFQLAACLEHVADGSRRFGATAAARVPARSLIRTDKYVSFKTWHCLSTQTTGFFVLTTGRTGPIRLPDRPNSSQPLALATS